MKQVWGEPLPQHDTLQTMLWATEMLLCHNPPALAFAEQAKGSHEVVPAPSWPQGVAPPG